MNLLKLLLHKRLKSPLAQIIPFDFMADTFGLLKPVTSKPFPIQNPKSKIQNRISGGFTLVELLVSIVIASIVVGTLLSFMTNILTSERREQAKATTELEIQSAIDYIADDLQEAVYIYNADGIAAIKNQLPDPRAIDKVPVLVFWKRTFFPQDRPVILNDGTTTRAGCLSKIADTDECDEKDYFVYSLVTYYLIKDPDSTESNTARIGRFEIRDGIRDPNNSRNYLLEPDPGFQLFDLTVPGTIEDKMNAWKNDASTAYDFRNNQIETLVDYVDQSTGKQTPVPQSCNAISPNAQQVPANDSTANPLNIYSFYACVDSYKSLAQVYLRGNALARLERKATYADSLTDYFPVGIIQVKSKVTLSGKS